jgi:hypothetical protein
MSFQAYVWAMGVASLMAWLGWVVVLFRVDPTETGAIGLLLFYVTLFAGLSGTFAVGGVLYRIFVLKRQQLVMREVRISFRHAVMVALVAALSLALSAQAWLSWWNMLGIVCLASFIEYVFVTIEESKRI